jgi:caffeoyl-CoA O-methyltransferase
MDIEDYIISHSDEEPLHLAAINRRTHLRLINPRMLSGHVQGRVLAMICRMIQPNNVLELGTYSGYSALCMAETVTDEAKIHTIEIEDELEEFILENIASSPESHKISLHIGKALDIIPRLDVVWDLVFMDADKREYMDYYECILPRLRSGGFILADNTLWDGKVIQEVHPNDRQTIEIMRFNDFVANDSRVEKVILPLRDGITIIRKK